MTPYGTAVITIWKNIGTKEKPNLLDLHFVDLWAKSDLFFLSLFLLFFFLKEFWRRDICKDPGEKSHVLNCPQGIIQAAQSILVILTCGKPQTVVPERESVENYYNLGGAYSTDISFLHQSTRRLSLLGCINTHG